MGDHHDGTAHKGSALFGLNCGEITISEIYWKTPQILYKYYNLYLRLQVYALITTFSRRNIYKNIYHNYWMDLNVSLLKNI